jgi:hypothetical protein
MNDTLPDRSRVRTALCAALGSAALLAAALTFPAEAGAVPATAAADAEGTATLTLGSRLPAARALRTAKVRVTRVSPARADRRGTRFTFAARSATVHSSSLASVDLAGGLRLRAGRRSVSVTGLRVALRSRQGRISAKVAGKRMTLFTFDTGSRRLTLESPATVKLSATYASLTRGAARVLARRLGRSGVVPGRLGKLKIVVDGAGGGELVDHPPVKPGEPPYLARPAGAVTARDVVIRWYPRSSFVTYVLRFGGSITPSDGASGSPQDGFTYGESPGRSWHHAASDTTALYGSGTVRFRVPGHGIDIAVSDPEVELNGAGSRVIFRVAQNGGEGTRRVAMELELRPKAVAGDGTVTYEALPGKVPEEGSIFSGGPLGDPYAPGEEFGAVTVSFRPGG